MYLELESINKSVRDDVQGFVKACEDEYESQIRHAAQEVEKNSLRSPLVFISGPSGASKTTTAVRLRRELERLGHRAHELSLDDYFRTVSPLTTPKHEDGSYDFESPLCLDMELLEDHFERLGRFEEIEVPMYDFTRQARSEKTRGKIKPERGDIVIFEGIHALADNIQGAHPESFGIFINADAEISCEGQLLMSGDDLRFVRRCLRDCQFRSRRFEDTLSIRPSVRRGEYRYIFPNRHRAALEIKSWLACELGVYKDVFLRLSENCHDDSCTRLRSLFAKTLSVSNEIIASNSVIREFMGGGQY